MVSRATVAGLLVVLAGAACDGTRDAQPLLDPAHDIGSEERCIHEWNTASNSANRAAVARGDKEWRVTVSRWFVDHPAEDLTGEGCTYFFFTDERWRSFSGAWEKDGDLRWDFPPPLQGPRTPEQNIQPPNAAVADDGTLE